MALRILILVLALLYGGLWLSLDSLPILDLPNHLTRATILHSLFFDSSSQFSHLYGFEWLFNTYILGDLLLISLLLVFEPLTVGVLYLALSFFLLPLSVWVYARRLGLAKEFALLSIFAAFYLSSNWFFLSGFLNYQLSIGLALLTLVSFENFLSGRNGWKFSLFFLLVTLTYFMHTASFIMCGVAIGVSLLFRGCLSKSKIVSTLLVISPFLLISVLHILIGGEGGEGGSLISTLEFRSAASKITAIGSMSYRFYLPIDALLLGIFFLVVALSLASYFKLGLQNSSKELIAMSSASFLVYLVAPVAMERAYDVDNRALPFAFIFILLAALFQLSKSEISSKLKRAIYVLLLTLPVMDLCYLYYYLPAENYKASAYRSLISSLPQNKAVLPVATIADTGRIQTSLHLGSFYTMEKLGYTPYLFSRTKSHPQTYFYFKTRLYSPDIFWYLRNYSVDWDRVRMDYDLIIITKPFDRARFPDDLGEKVAENEAAVVYSFKR